MLWSFLTNSTTLAAFTEDKGIFKVTNALKHIKATFSLTVGNRNEGLLWPAVSPKENTEFDKNTVEHCDNSKTHRKRKVRRSISFFKSKQKVFNLELDCRQKKIFTYIIIHG